MLYQKEKLEKLQHRWTTAKGKRLIKAIRSSRCYLSPVLFKQKVQSFYGINDEEVRDGIDLRGASLAGFDFRIAVKEDENGYTEDLAILSGIHFEGANLKHANFQDGKIHDCFFDDSDLSHAEFKGSTINSCGFQGADCSGMNINNAKLINCSFVDATITDMSASTAYIDQKTNFGTKLKSEKEDNYHFAAIEYKQIKEMCKNSSLHSLADRYHYKEMVAKRKTNSRLNPSRWLNYIFGDLLCKYGTSFVHVMIASAMVILTCAVFYTIHDGLLYHNTALVTPSLPTSAYFSLVTFTTLGYGDYHAVGALRFLAASESFIGATLLSLFTVIVARQIIRD